MNRDLHAAVVGIDAYGDARTNLAPDRPVSR